MVTLATKTFHPFQFFGLAKDTKPTVKYGDEKIENGDSFLEMDTGTLYFYNRENDSWIVPQSK